MRKKNKCPKKNFQSVERGKNVSVEFRVFGKKMEIERKVPEKKIRVLWVKILLSSCSLVGFLKLKLRLQRKFKNQGFLFTGFVPTGWAPCCE